MFLVPPQVAIRPAELSQLVSMFRVDVIEAARTIAKRCRIDDGMLLEKLAEKANAADQVGDFHLTNDERNVPRGLPRKKAGYLLRLDRRALLVRLARVHVISQVRLVEALILRVWRDGGGGTPGGYQGPDDVEVL